MTTTGHETCHHRMYGLSCDGYEGLLARARGHCERCRVSAREVYRGKLVIDHEGRIGWHAVRGLLCQKCNAHMRRVDAAERPIDRGTFAYLDLSGHFVPQGTSHLGSDRPCSEVRAEVLAQITASADAVRGAPRAKPRLACAPRAVTAPW